MLNFYIDLFVLILSCCIYTTLLVAYFLKRLKSVQDDMKEIMKNKDNDLKMLKDDILEIRSCCLRSEHILRYEMNFSRLRYQRAGLRYVETPYPRELSDGFGEEIADAFNLITKCKIQEDENDKIES